MDRLQRGNGHAAELREYASWGDCAMVVASLVLLLLGLQRQVRADERGAFEPQLLLAAGTGVIAAADTGATTDATVECPPEVCAPACCDPIYHVLDPWGVDPLWSGRAEALLLWRGSPQGLPLFENVGGGSALNANNFGSGMAAGPRFTLFRHTGDDGAIEFNYLRVENFSATENLPLTDGGYVQSSRGIYCCPSTTQLDTVSGGLTSALQSFELNRRFPTNNGWQWLTGFRWVQWQENILIETSAVDGLLRNSYDTGTFNDLYGWQFGADSILYGLGTPFRIEGLGKAGVYYNQASQHSANTLVDPVQSSTLAVRTSVAQAAFVGEVGLTAVYDIYDWLSFRAGYAAFWLGGIAQATNQLDSQKLCNGQPIAGTTDTGGSVWVQGITLGLEARY